MDSSINNTHPNDADQLKTVQVHDPAEDDVAELLAEVTRDESELDLTNRRIRTIPKLPQTLTALTLRNNFIKIYNLSYLINLQTLDLYDNAIETMQQPLPPSLTSVDFSFNAIKNIELDNMPTELQELYLANNKIKMIAQRLALPRLRVLELGSNRIRRIENLELPELTQLWLGKNKIARIENLDQLSSLILLSIQSNRLTKIEGLDALVNLEELYMSHNGIENIEGLHHLTKLRVLDIAANRLTKLTNINHLKKLEELWLNDNLLSDWDDVRALQLPSLKTIYLERNPVQEAVSSDEYRSRLRTAIPTLTQIDAYYYE